jgi:hypothetical protein
MRFLKRYPTRGVIALAALVTLALSLPASMVMAGGTYHSPPHRNNNHKASTSVQQTPYYLPPGAPVDRTYTWYAPPGGYEVIWEGSPAAPATVAIVGPDGVERTYRLEGRVVFRPHSYVVVRSSSR